MCGGVGGCAGRVCVRLSTTTFFPQSSLLPWNHCECVGMCNIPTHSHSHPHPHTHTPTPTYLCVQVCGCGCGCALCVCLFMCVFEHDNLLPPLLAFAMGSLCVSVWVCGCVGVGVCIGGCACLCDHTCRALHLLSPKQPKVKFCATVKFPAPLFMSFGMIEQLCIFTN